MFHHFHDGKKHLKGQGSIDQNDFYKLIKFVGKKNILNANEFYIRLKEKKLKKNNVCLTFDDSLKCQYDIALPVLEDMGIKGFFFIYSSALTKIPDLLEIYRHFRINFFEDIDHFYKKFFGICINLINKKKIDLFFKINEKKMKYWKIKFPFYSLNDIKFRFLRDKLLSKKQYDKLMFLLIDDNNFDYKSEYKRLFLTINNVKKISNLGHVIGLHSHTHPTMIENLSKKKQKDEYKSNKIILEKITNKKIFTMAHPFGSYNNYTLKILDKLDINLGFKGSIKIDERAKKINNSNLEVSREDHANIIKRIRK